MPMEISRRCFPQFSISIDAVPIRLKDKRDRFPQGRLTSFQQSRCKRALRGRVLVWRGHSTDNDIVLAVSSLFLILSGFMTGQAPFRCHPNTFSTGLRSSTAAIMCKDQ